MGKRILKRKMEKLKLIRKIRIIILFLIIGIITNVGIGMYKENKIRLKDKKSIVQKLNQEENIVINEQEERKKEENIIRVEIPETYLGFRVVAKLEIPKINLETYILEEYQEDGMKVCASKFWGPNPNEVGNFCIAGHNYEQERMFNHLIDLEIGDELYLSDNINGKKKYNVFDIYKVKPQNVDPLEQETNGEKQVTLITCVNYSRNRLIVQAKE